MNIFIKKELNVREIIFLILVLFLSIGFQLLVIRIVPGYSGLFLIFLVLILVSIVLYTGYIKEFPVYLLILNFIPLLILDNEVHYNFILELLSFIPLFFLIIYAIFKYILSSTTFAIRIGYLELPIILIVIYFGISALIANFEHRDTYWIVNEYFPYWFILNYYTYILFT